MTAFGSKVLTAVLKTDSWWKGKRKPCVWTSKENIAVCLTGKDFFRLCFHLCVELHMTCISPYISSFQFNSAHYFPKKSVSFCIVNKCCCLYMHRACFVSQKLHSHSLILLCLDLCSKLLVVGGARVRCWAFTPLPLFLLGSGVLHPWSLRTGELSIPRRL